ncbi:unnamed protein product, partial [Polarella glacialis]
EPPTAPPRQVEEEGGRDPSKLIECEVSAAYRRGELCGSASCKDPAAQPKPDYRDGSEVWLFRQVYTDDFEVLLRKMGYHLPMIYRNVSISCGEKSLSDLWQESCVDCIRHLTSDAYGEMGMVVPAHPDPKLRGRSDAPDVGAAECLTQGMDYSASAPGSGLFCRTRQREAWA